MLSRPLSARLGHSSLASKCSEADQPNESDAARRDFGVSALMLTHSVCVKTASDLILPPDP